MTHSADPISDGHLFRPALQRLIPNTLFLVSFIFLIHAAIRFSGLLNPLFIPLSMVIIWPLPWLLSPKPSRRQLGFRAPVSAWWFLGGPAVALLMLAFCFTAAWLIIGGTNDNWFVQHALTLHKSLGQTPASTSTLIQFGIVTIPAMLFSPLAEEFLYRGYLLRGLSNRWGLPAGMVTQALAFTLVHLTHYGLVPYQPILITVWLPCMFLAALGFGWITQKSRSIWIAVLSHSVFNLGMNAVVFLAFPTLIEL
ncbi:MAG: type II CAAX endopeptidase family protein [Balneolaceae bacterium]|nr:type II CAAX endopeptidase family protein [Balneolaceae bacterium]